MLQKVNEILILLVFDGAILLFGGVSSQSSATSSNIINFLTLQILDLLLQPFDHFLTEMTSLGELLLYFFVDLDVALQCCDLTSHFAIFIQQLLGLFRLIL